MPKVVIHDFRVTDKILAETDPDAGNVVYLGRTGTAGLPFVVLRRVSGPSGWYVDTCEIVGPERHVVAERRAGARIVETAERPVLASWEKKFEIEGESMPSEVVDELPTVSFPKPGEYVLRYSVYDEHLIDVPFSVLAEDPPYGVVVPGPLDAALSKSTICWVTPLVDGARATQAVWYGYRDGRIHVLVGPGEQRVPGLTKASRVLVRARSKEKQSLVAEVECTATVLAKDAAWDSLAKEAMLGRRLNLRDGEQALDRWRQTCEIVALTPLPTPGT
ncbi:MAG: hypothetical protein HY775_06340 [Acidobacteria bacterium]|nr:hypothetical protein [Acidobacteriota bacterium]